METINYLDLDKEFLILNNYNEICVIKDEIDYYLKINIKNTFEKIVVFSNGAVNRDKSELPVFMRNTWADEINGSTIFIDDRTIHDSELMIGWGIGREKIYFLDEIGIIIQKIINILEYNSDDTYYYGSSAGGTMSMVLATKHKNSTAIVNNPQMFTYNYLEGKPVEKINKTYFNNYSKEEFIDKFKERLSVPYLIKQEAYIPKSIYIFNKASAVDYKDQYVPFVREINSAGLNLSNIQYYIYTNRQLGHNPLPKTNTIKIINATLDGLFLK